MKRTYHAPALEIVGLQPESVIALSKVGVVADEANGIDAGASWSKHKDGWDSSAWSDTEE